AMLEEHSDRDSVLFAPSELRDVFRDRIVKADLALVEEHHEGRRRADDLGQRGQVVDRAVRADRRAAPLPAELSEALLPHRGATAADYDRGPGITTGGNASLNDAVHDRQPLAGHADGLGRLHGKAAAAIMREESGDEEEKH